MPVVDMDDHTLSLLNIMRPDGGAQLQRLHKALVHIHDNPGGDDVAYLESC